MAFIELTKDNFEEMINKQDKILVDFWASWCAPCSILGAILAGYEDEHQDAVIGKYDVGKDQIVPDQFGIQSIPTVLLFERGELKERKSGIMDSEELEKFFNL